MDHDCFDYHFSHYFLGILALGTVYFRTHWMLSDQGTASGLAGRWFLTLAVGDGIPAGRNAVG